MGSCQCKRGWTGEGCELGQCLDDCNHRGVCDSHNYDIPQCVTCDVGWMGESCNVPCFG